MAFPALMRTIPCIALCSGRFWEHPGRGVRSVSPVIESNGDFAAVDGLGLRHIEEQKRRKPSCSIRLWRLPHDRFQPIYDRSLHCDPMIRKRVIRVHVNFGNTCVTTLTQPIREFLIIRRVAIVSFQH